MQVAQHSLNADLSQPATMRAGDGRWVDSPEPGVRRLMLERHGGEVARATTIVRYQPGARFARHVHELGEEFLVLDGIFSDEAGHYGAGTYVRNPPGSSHAPYSAPGCSLFVKLRQMRVGSATTVVATPASRIWMRVSSGVQTALLHEDEYETVLLVRLDAGCSLPPARAGVEEILVVEGAVDLSDEPGGNCPASTWLRRIGGQRGAIGASVPSLLWVKIIRAC